MTLSFVLVTVIMRQKFLNNWDCDLLSTHAQFESRQRCHSCLRGIYANISAEPCSCKLEVNTFYIFR
jgi:hypothetical protein